MPDRSMIQFNPRFRVVAVGTWLYDGATSREIELICGPRPDNGELTYMVGWITGSGFASAAAAKAWADSQPWGPVTWRETDRPTEVAVVDDE